MITPQFTLRDRVKERISVSGNPSTGTGIITLLGAPAGFQTFLKSNLPNLSNVCYCIESGNDWETGYGVYNSDNGTITRGFPIDSSNNRYPINIVSTFTYIFITVPARYTLTLEDNRGLILNGKLKIDEEPVLGIPLSRVAGHGNSVLAWVYDAIYLADASGKTCIYTNNGAITFNSGDKIGFSSGAADSGDLDTPALRDSAGCWGFRNGTTAQKIRIGKTYTSDTDREDLELGWDAGASAYNVVNRAGSAGGLTRAIRLGSIDGVGAFAGLIITAGGVVGIGTTSPALQSGGNGANIYGASTAELKFTNAVTGGLSTDGTALVSNGLSFTINNREAGNITLGTSNAVRLTIDSGGTSTFAGDITASGTITASAGTAAAPSVRFATDPTSGIYQDTGGVVRVTISGTRRASFVASGLQLLGGTTTASAPSLSIDNGGTTGLFLPGAGIVAVSSAGTECMRVSSSAITATGNLTLQNSTTAVIAEFSKTFTSSTSREYLQVGFSGTNYDFVSRVGSAGGSNQPLRLGHLAADGTTFTGLTVATSGEIVSHANGGLTIWKTTDQVTNFGKINIAHTTSSNTAIAKYDLLGGGTIAVGWHAFYVGGVSRLEIDAASALSYGNLYFSADNTKDIGRMSTAAYRPRSIYVGTSVQIGMPANTPIVGALQVGGAITASGVTIAPASGGCRVVMVPIDGSSDTYIDSTVTGDSTKRWAFGIDNSANKFCIAKNASGSGTPFGSADLFTIDSTGNTTVGGTLYLGSNILVLPFNGTAYSTYVANGTGLSFFGASGAAGYGFSVSGNTVTLTSGARTELAMRRTFAPTSGTATFTQILMQPTIDQTGGANGISRGLWINPDITAAADWRAIEVTTGKSIFQAVEAAAITASGGITVTDPGGSSVRKVNVIQSFSPPSGNGGSVLDVQFRNGTKASPTGPIVGNIFPSFSVSVGGSSGAIFTNPAFALRHEVETVASSFSNLKTHVYLAETGSGTPAARMTFQHSNGRVGINNTSPAATLDVGGTITTSGKVSINNSALGSSALDVFASHASNPVSAIQQQSTSSGATALQLIVNAVTGTSYPLKSVGQSTGSHIIEHLQNGAGASVVLLRTLGTAAGNDIYYAYNLAYDTAVWSHGIDASDSYKFKLGPNTNPSTGTAAITIDTSGNTTVGGNLTLQNSTTAVIAELSKTYTSYTNREYFYAGFSGTNYDLVSRVGSAGGSNQPLRLGHLAADGTTFVGMTVATDGTVTGTGNFSRLTGIGSEQFGANSTVGGFNSATAIGESASVTGTAGTAVGRLAVAANSGIAVGASASGGNSGVSVGNGATSGTSSTAIGQGATASNSVSIAIGRSATTTTTNQLVVGASGLGITTVAIGNGVTNAAPAGFTLHATGGSGTNIAGASITIAGGRGTGSAVGGDIIFQTAPAGASGSTLGTLTEQCRISAAGAITASGNLTYVPATSTITLGTNGQFAIEMTSNTAGNLVYRGSDGTTRRMALTFV